MTVDPSQLTLEPNPLLFSKHNVVLSWSPKSACTQALVWFLIHENLLKASNDYSRWPHNYRQQVYYQQPQYKQRLAALKASGGKGYTLIRVTRDPVKRLVSCFRHAVRFPAIDGLVQKKLGRNPERDGLSLEDFHQTLHGEDLVCWNGFDMHVCAQQHPVWYYGFDRIITINADETDLYGALNQAENALGMKRTVFANYPKFQNLANGHHARDIEFSGTGPVEKFRFQRGLQKEFPKAAFTASPRLPEVARDLHGRDFGQVSTGDTAGELFTRTAPACPG